MKSLVVYDSTYGNTKLIAEAIAEGIGGETRALPVSEASSSDLSSVDLLVVGSPTQGGRATPAIKAFLGNIPAAALQNTNTAAFDTRISAKDQGIALRTLMGVIGYAAPRIAKDLQAKGGRMAAAPEGFIVEEKEGPLRRGESERAAAWARGLESGA